MSYLKFYLSDRFRFKFQAALVLILALVHPLFQAATLAQTAAANADASAQTSISPAAPSPTPIPFSDIIAQSDQANATLTRIAADTSANPTAETVERDLPVLTEEINQKLAETAEAVESRASLEQLRNFETEWRNAAKNLPQWNRDLTARARQLEANLIDLAELEQKWRATESQQIKQDTPPEVSTRIQNVLTIIGEARRQIEARQARLVSLQDQVAEQQKRVDGALASLRQTREALVGQLLVQDNPPIWNQALWSPTPADVRHELSRTLTVQANALNDFVGRNVVRIVVHLLIFLTFAGLLVFLRRRAQLSVEQDPTLKSAAVIFYLPVSTALVLAILFSSRLYPPSPPILSAIFGAIALVPTVIVLRRLVARSLDPILYSLVIFYFIDLLRTITDSQPIVSRLLFLAEMFGGFAFFLWLYRAKLSSETTEEIRGSRVFRTFRFVALAALPVFAVAFVADVFGYVGLARLLGNAVLRSAYVALIFYGVVRIADGLIIFALRFRPLCYLKMVQTNRLLIEEKARKFLRFLAIAAWILFTLEFLSVRESLFERIAAIFNARLTVGSLDISLGNVALFAVTVWAAFALSRFVRFALEEDVYPRVALERGLPYAISTILNYAILLLGFFLAVAAAGFDLTRFSILAGAFGVGIGFGLQNIINNFVSGLILLFERPVKVGDLIKIGDATGTVKRIGIRASVVHVWDNSDIIVPNSRLISENVINWTFSTEQRGIEIVFNVPPAAPAAPKKIVEIMEKAAEDHPLVADNPMPQVLFDEVSFDRLTFKLRIWTDYFDKVLLIRSDLVLNISQALKAENIPHEKINSEEDAAAK